MNPFEGYQVTSPYGWRIHPVEKVLKFHAGIDLFKYHRAPIYAFTDGVVQFAGQKEGIGFGGLGNVVAIIDQYSVLHCYAHLDSVSVKIGQVVKKGQEIGKQGATGTATNSHLHYEVRPKSEPNNGWNSDPQIRTIDPTQYLLKYYEMENKEDEYMLNPDDANKIIRFLSAGWFVVQGNKEAEKEFHRLANELRKASGQKEQ